MEKIRQRRSVRDGLHWQCHRPELLLTAVGGSALTGEKAFKDFGPGVSMGSKNKVKKRYIPGYIY